MDRFDEMRTRKVTQQVVTKEITVTPQTVVAITGQAQQFTANEDVTWSIDGNLSPNTTISSTGLLSVAQDERSKFITIIATSGNRAGYAQASIKAQYIITFDPAGGTFENGSTEPIEQTYFAGEVITNIPTVEKVDYKLTNWTNENGIVLNENTKASENMTYTAEWTSTKVDIEDVELVEYIESTGTQWIDTGYLSTNTTRIELDAQFKRTGVTQTNGTTRTAGRVTIGLHKTYSGFYLGIASQNYNYKTADTNRHLFFLDLKNKKYGYDDYSTTYTGNNLTDKSIITLFARNEASSTTDVSPFEYCEEKIYACRIYDNDVLVRDFKPVKDFNGIACLYDTVTETFFYNQGTGNFVTP